MHFPSDVKDDTQKRFFLTWRDKKTAEVGRPDHGSVMLLQEDFNQKKGLGETIKANGNFKET